MNVFPVHKTDSQATELMQPSYGAFYSPSMDIDYFHEVCCVLQGEVRFHDAAVLGDGVLSRRHGLHRWTQDAFSDARLYKKQTVLCR